jgi:predicted Zn-dependent peptidase
MRYAMERLPCGAGLAVAEMPHVQSVSVGLWLGVGGRHEPRAIHGVSHFIEHLLFKGTSRRTAREISEAVEGVGGYLNAFTAEEMTCYFAKASAKHLPVLIDVLMDMLIRARFPADEIERERGVIIEEIRMYEDQPGQVAQERLNALMWPGHPLGRPLAGTVDIVSRMKRTHLMNYRKRFYTAGNLWITVAGHTTLAEVKHLLAPVAKWIPRGPRAQAMAARDRQRKPGSDVVRKPIEQSHLAMGLRGVSRHDPRRFAMKLLNVILGENMSSRLFQSIRERHGLAYSISSSVSYLEDTGSLSVQAGLENGKLGKAVRLTLKAIHSLAEKAPTSHEVRRAKDYTVGQMHLSLESTTNQLMWMGEGLVGHGRILDPQKITEQIEAVSAEEIRSVAAFLASNRRLNAAVVSPVAEAAELREAVRLG